MVLKYLPLNTVTMKKQKEKKEDHPILNQVLTPEFLKQFKDSGELNSFMEQLYSKAMEQMLEGEMDTHLGYEKYSSEGINSGNSRNGKSSKSVKTTLGEIDLEVPRDRNGSFEPVLIPKRSRKVEAIEDMIISLYARGMTVRDIEAQIREVPLADQAGAPPSHRALLSLNHFKFGVAGRHRGERAVLGRVAKSARPIEIGGRT